MRVIFSRPIDDHMRGAFIINDMEWDSAMPIPVAGDVVQLVDPLLAVFVRGTVKYRAFDLTFPGGKVSVFLERVLEVRIDPADFAVPTEPVQKKRRSTLGDWFAALANSRYSGK